MQPTVEDFEPLIRQLVRQRLTKLPANIEKDDLLQVARIAVWRSIKLYDPEKGAKIETYLSAQIRGAMSEMLRSLDPLTRNERGDVNQLSEVEKELQNLGQYLTDQEIATKLEWDIERVTHARLKESFCTLTSTSPEDEDDPTFFDVSTPADEVERQIETRQNIANLDNISFTKQEKDLIRYILLEGLSLVEIGALWGVTSSFVSQKLAVICQKIKHYHLRPNKPPKQKVIKPIPQRTPSFDIRDLRDLVLPSFNWRSLT
jgi:RNA polymerase sigma factor for flagellar operon FliA